MAKIDRTVVEIAADDVRQWLIIKADAPEASYAAAVKSPLTGAWLVGVRVWGEADVCYRATELRGARMVVLGGNGRQYGRSSEVTHVWPCSSHDARKTLGLEPAGLTVP
jgi:hypothetical protein